MGSAGKWALIYMVTIALGYGLKQLGILKAEDKRVFSAVVFYLTLPAMLIGSFGEISVDFWILVAFAMGLLGNAVMLAAGFVMSTGKTPDMRAIYIINCPGYNVANVTIPFVQSFFPAGIPYLCMFDAADSFFSLGTTYSIACMQLGRQSGSKFGNIIRGLFRSVLCDTYLVMMTLTLLGIALPAPVMEVAEFIGRGNGFLVMLMVGVSLEIHMKKEEVGEILRIMLIRLSGGAAIAAAIYFLLPGPLVLRQALALGAFSAVPNVCLIYSNRLGVSTNVPSALNPISTLVSLPVIAGLATLMI